MNIEIKGQILEINQTEVKSEKFSKREFKVTTDGQYPEIFKIQVTNDKCPLLDKFKVNEYVNAHCNLKGREWIKPETGAVSNFITLDCWRIEQVTNEVQVSNTIVAEPDDLF